MSCGKLHKDSSPSTWICVAVILFGYLKWVLNNPVLRPSWSSVIKQKRQRPHKRARDLKQRKITGFKFFICCPPRYCLSHLRDPGQPIHVLPPTCFHSGCCSFCLTLHHPTQSQRPQSSSCFPSSTPQYKSSLQPLNIIVFLLVKQPPLQVLLILVFSPLLLPLPISLLIFPLPVLKYTLNGEQGLILFAL